MEILIPPGLGFGTGRHPTTALCLEALAARELSGLPSARLRLRLRHPRDRGARPGGRPRGRGRPRSPGARGDPRERPPQPGGEPAAGRCRRRRCARAARFDLVLANILARPLAALAPLHQARPRARRRARPLGPARRPGRGAARRLPPGARAGRRGRSARAGWR
ncbi:MAG: 50S ribosomal protein L11 methyltransferase [Xanthomonadales bacterium]|nr:50S ribosomal protein L11 methyltransferase [Xanthomonadales bacterium]